MYKSIEHRAVRDMNTTRMSVATFVYPDEVQFSPVESIVIDRPRLYRDAKYLDYLTGHLGRHWMENVSGDRKYFMNSACSFLRFFFIIFLAAFFTKRYLSVEGTGM